MKKDHCAQDVVTIKLKKDELDILCNILDCFIKQNKEVHEFAGVNTKKQESLVNKLYDRLDETFLSNFGYDDIYKELSARSIK